MSFTQADQRRYELAYREFVEGIETTCRERLIDLQPWPTDLPFEEVFLELLSRVSALAES